MDLTIFGVSRKWSQTVFVCPNVYWLEKEMATHSSVVAWRIPGTGGPGGLQSTGSLRVRHDWATSLSLFTLLHWRRKWQPTPVFLPGESQGWGSLVGCRSMGSHRVGHDWSDVAAAAACDWFSRQERWSGLPFPSPMQESEKIKWSCLVVSDS